MTSPHTHRGRVYRRCACRHAGKQLGARCPELTSNARHGTWTFAVDLPSLTGKRATMRRGGYATRKAATAALTCVLDCERTGIWLDDRQTVADYLTTYTWLAEKSRTLKPTTAAVYTDYIVKDLIPAFGAIRLDPFGRHNPTVDVADERSERHPARRSRSQSACDLPEPAASPRD